MSARGRHGRNATFGSVAQPKYRSARVRNQPACSTAVIDIVPALSRMAQAGLDRAGEGHHSGDSFHIT